MDEAEQRDIERLADEVSGLNEGLDRDRSLIADRGTYKMTVAGGFTRVDRDPESGRVLRTVGPNVTTVVDRDPDTGRVIGWHTEREDIVPE